MRLMLYSVVALACFAGLSRAGGYGVPMVLIPAQRDQVFFQDTVEYVPQIRREVFVQRQVDYVPAPVLLDAPCATCRVRAAVFAPGVGVQRFRSRTVVRDRGLFFRR